MAIAGIIHQLNGEDALGEGYFDAVLNSVGGEFPRVDQVFYVF